MLSKLVKTAPRLLQSSNYKLIPIAFQSTNGKVIESDYKPSGAIPTGEDYHQIPVNFDGKDHVCSPDSFVTVYPFVPSLESISIEKQLIKKDEKAEEIEPEFQEKTLEDKIRVWFGPDMPTKYDDQKPERDLENHPRIPFRLTEKTPTRMYFLPESWFKFFEPKTGRLGGYTFGVTFGTFLVSKEIFCYNENAHTGLALAALAYIFINNYGKQVNDFAKAHIIKENQGWCDWQHGMIKLLKEHLGELKKVEDRSINPGLIYEAKRENLQLQQEAEYRRRLMSVYNEVKRKLDYQVAIEDAKKNFTRKHLVNWVIDNVNKNLNAELEKAVLKQCVFDLKTLSEKRRNAI